MTSSKKMLKPWQYQFASLMKSYIGSQIRRELGDRDNEHFQGIIDDGYKYALETADSPLQSAGVSVDSIVNLLPKLYEVKHDGLLPCGWYIELDDLEDAIAKLTERTA